nr:anti-sigma factor [Petropleomorpha daqingensis]
MFDELAVGWALHSLEPEDEALFVRHLPDCARCARTVSETSEVMAALAADLPAAEPSAQLGDRLRAAVERTEQVPLPAPDDTSDLAELDDFDEPVDEPAPPRRATGFPHYEHVSAASVPTPTPWRRLLPSLLVAAAVVVILALGTWNVMLSEARTSAESAAQQQSEVLHRVLQPGQATIARLADEAGHEVATVVARPESVQVVTDGLAVNDRTQSVYVVWGMRDSGAVPIGTFDVDRAQMDLSTVGSSDESGLDGYPAYAISLERGRSAPPVPSDVVARGQVTS